MTQDKPRPYYNGKELAKISKGAKQTLLQAQALTKTINNRKYKQADVYAIGQRCCEYIEDCQRNKKPLTIAGFIMASNIPQSVWYEMKNGEHDVITSLYHMQHNYTDDDGAPLYVDEQTGEARPLATPSEIVKNCYLMIQAQLEGNCYTNKGNPAGSIFGLKAQFGWSDDTTPQHLTQVVQICDAEQAQKALEMLHG